MTLTKLLLARIAEDEEVASHGDGGLMDEAHFSSRRVLAECKAKRRIVEEYEAADSEDAKSWERGDDRLVYASQHAHTLYFVLCNLASVYADHPDYRQEWRWRP